MNDYCKECLAHSWGKTPDRKKLEKEYNSGYYKRNRDKILLRASERRTAKTSKDYDVASAPFHLYDSPSEFFDYSKKALTAIVKTLNESANITRKVSKTVKQGSEFVKDKLKTPIRIITNTALVKSVKNVFNRIKYYLSKATI